MPITSQSRFLHELSRRVLVFDGAMGTCIHGFTLDVHKDHGGLENCSEILCATRPDVVGQIHESFLAAGCDAVETNTFGSNKIVLNEFGIAGRVFELNKRACEIAHEACAKYSTAQKPRFVVGAMGPGTRLPTLGHTTFDVLVDSYAEQVRGLIAGRADVLLIETQQDLLTVKAALNAAMAVMEETGVVLPVMVQVTIETTGTMLVGSDMSAVVAAIEPYDCVVSLGLNCATGPAEMGEHVQYLSHHWPRLISVLPNAGLPIIVDGKAHYPLTPNDFTQTLTRFVNDYGVNIVGGCCGTTQAHLKALCDAVAKLKAESRQQKEITWRPQVSSIYSAEDVRQDASYLIIAERTNTNGSKKFRTLLEAADFDGMVAMAKDEMRDGSHVLDVCVDYVGRDGVRDIGEVISRFVQQVAAPIMIDSTSPEVMEAGLKLAGGRCILNSMNLEDGEERIARICDLARRFGAAVVCGTIDEDKQAAMARTADRKLEIAWRIRDLAVKKYGMRPQDLLFDPLVLPISTGIEEDRRNALETIEGIRRISRELPDCHTVIGLSNVSFGLKPSARVVLNSVFLHECREAGLSGAIVHVSKILPRTKIEDAKWEAAMDLIYDRRENGDPLTRFISLFSDDQAPGTRQEVPSNLPLNERLQKHIIDGDKRDLGKDLTEAMGQWPPLTIINEHLLAGMKVVGELFGSGQMQLPFVLQSAEVMKAAVAYLQPFMEKSEGTTRGKIVLATVKGDVHDIGKNLVDIILSNNGYTVYNLGIKQPAAAILHAAQEHSVDAIGMSGLLVKSVAVMKENLQEMNAQHLRVPVLLGGAALTRSYTEDDLAKAYQGPLFYCKDAFEGLHTMDRIMAGEVEEVLEEKRLEIDRRTALRLRAEACVRPSENLPDHSDVQHDNPVPVPPFWGRRMVKDIPLKEVFPFINELALFRGQWGFKKGKLSDAEFERLTNEKARPVFRRLCAEAIAQKLLEPKLVYGYFPCQSDGDDLIVYHPDSMTGEPREWLRFTFPRQTTRRRLCICDFFRSRSSRQFDVLGIQAVTVGQRISERTQELFKSDQYQEYLYWHGFGVESAEALAELWHKRVRAELGFASEDSPKIREIFTQGYRGSRYSFGYGACPNLDDRAKIMELLQGEEIGLTLSENFMLVPEQSTDAIIVHHPQAKYFDV